MSETSFALTQSRPRIVSMLPSATEIVCALGFEYALVGRSHECDYPASVRALPVCTAPKFDPDGTSYEIDQRVKAVLQEGLSVYRVDAEMLRALRPDVIVTQEHCEVCAVDAKEVEQAVCDWLDSRPTIVSLAPNRLADIWNDMQRVADALGAPQQGRELVERLTSRIDDLARSAPERPWPPRVALIEWIDPLMAAGNWMPELVGKAGGVNLFGDAGSHSPWLDWDDLLDADPDRIIVMPCGFDIERARRDLPLLTEREGWRDLAAVTKGYIALADGNQFFNRPGPRLVESLEILVEILHVPGRFGHRGPAWQWLT